MIPRIAYVVVVLWAAGGLARADSSGFADSVMALQEHMRHGQERTPPDMPDMLRAKRQEALDYTRRKIEKGERLGMREWLDPLRTLYGWSQSMEWTDATSACRASAEMLALLRQADEGNALAAANAAAGIVGALATCWLEADAPAVIRLMDETEAWVLALTNRFSGPMMVTVQGKDGQLSSYPFAPTALPRAWYAAILFSQANLLWEEDQFPPGQRAWLWQSRTERLRAIVLCPSLEIRLRMYAVANWGKALVYNGRADEAERLIRGWMRLHPDSVILPDMLMVLMQVYIMEQANWEQAAQLLAFADEQSRAGHYKRNVDQSMYRQITELYYAKSVLPEHELLRQRHVREQERLERLRAADLEHAARQAQANPAEGKQ